MASRNDIPGFTEMRGVETLPGAAAEKLRRTARQSGTSLALDRPSDDLNRAAAMFGRSGQILNSGYQQLAEGIGTFGEKIRRDQAAEIAAQDKIFLARQELEAREKLQTAALEADTDPEKFAVAAGKVKRSMMEAVPGWASEQTNLMIDEFSSQLGRNIAAKQHALGKEQSLQSGLETRLRYASLAEDAAARGDDAEAQGMVERVETLNRSMLEGGMISAADYVQSQAHLADGVQLQRVKGRAERLISAGDFAGARDMLGAMRAGNIDLIVKEATAQGVPPVLALAIAKIESNFDHTAKNPGSTARGLFQHLNSTWTGQGGTDENRSDPAEQVRLGVDLIKQNYASLKSGLGREPQAWELYAAHQQGAAGFLKLHRNKDSDMAALVGDDAANKNGGAGKTAGQFLELWQRKFAAADADAGELVKLAAMPVHLREKAANNIEGSLHAQQSAFNAERQIIGPQLLQAAEAYRKGRAVDPAFVEPLLARARAVGAADFIGTVENGQRLYSQTVEFAKLPPMAQQEQLARLSVGGAFDNDLQDAYATIHRETVEKIKSDPLGLAMAQGHVEQTLVTAGSPPEAFAERAAARIKAEELYGVPVPLLRQGEVDALNQSIGNAPSAVRAQLMAGMQAGFSSSGQPGLFVEALGKLAEKNPEFSHAGIIALRDPEAARMILDGTDGRKLQKQFDVKDDDFRRQFDTRLPPEALAGFDPKFRNGLEQAIRAHYVGASIKVNDVTGMVDGDRMKAAVDAVTGGVVSVDRPGLFGGGFKTFAAWPGQTAGEMEQLISLVSDADLDGMYLMDGDGKGGGRLSVQTFREAATLISRGNGGYSIQVGENPVLGRDFQPVILNLEGMRNRLSEDRPLPQALPPAPSFSDAADNIRARVEEEKPYRDAKKAQRAYVEEEQSIRRAATIGRRKEERASSIDAQQRRMGLNPDKLNWRAD